MKEKSIYDDENIVVDTEEILPEDADMDIETEEMNWKDKLRDLRAKLTATEAEKKQCQDELQRTRADFLNSRRRLEEQYARDKERATDRLLTELLTLADSFDMAMMDTAVWDSVDVKWRSGVEAIYTKLMTTLKDHGVTPLEALGKPFNPEEHNAVSNSIVTDKAQIDTVRTVLQKGYIRNDVVIRPAMVVVGVIE